MKKLAIYSGLTAASIVDITTFLISTTYFQLVVAILLYLSITYLVFKLFPRKTRIINPTLPSLPNNVGSVGVEQSPSEQQIDKELEISDINKRAFLKIIGAAGISFFISSLFSRRAESLILGKTEGSGLTTLQDTTGKIINPAEHYATDNYKISEVDYGINTYYGLIDQAEGWFIMKEDMNAGTYRYVKGDTNFYDNWNNRENLNYDFFNRVFPKG